MTLLLTTCSLMVYPRGSIIRPFDLFSILEDTIPCKKDVNFHLQTVQIAPSLSAFLLHYLFTPSFTTRRVGQPFYLCFNVSLEEGVVATS